MLRTPDDPAAQAYRALPNDVGRTPRVIRRIATLLFACRRTNSRSHASTCRRRKARRRFRRFSRCRRQSSSAIRCATAPAAAPLRVIAYDANDIFDSRRDAQFFVVDSGAVGHVDRTACVIVVTSRERFTSSDQVAGVQTTRRHGARSPVAPRSIRRSTAKVDTTLKVPLTQQHRHDAEVVGSANIAVTLRGAGGHRRHRLRW